MTDRHTPLYDTVVALGGKLISFAGYRMPVQFTSIRQEHLAVRQAAGAFDVSHMSRFHLTGPGAVAAADRLLTNAVSRLKKGDVQYALMCTPDGGIIDDLLVYRLNEQDIMLVMNATRHDTDIAYLQRSVPSNVVCTDQRDQMGQIALQGPLAVDILNSLDGHRWSKLRYMTFDTGLLNGVSVLISRTGYTGEDGFEIYCDSADMSDLFNAILAAGAPVGLLPVGLGARDTLRLEARLPLYGHELTEETSPLEARLGWAVALDHTDFVGKEAIVHQKTTGVHRRLMGFEMTDRGIARHGHLVMSATASPYPIGEVTSGSYVPWLNRNIGLAYVPLTGYKVGSPILIDIRGKYKAARIVKTPFYSAKSNRATTRSRGET